MGQDYKEWIIIIFMWFIQKKRRQQISISEKFAHTNASKYRVTVATSDGLEQVIIRGEGCRLLSAGDLKTEMEQASRNLRMD